MLKETVEWCRPTRGTKYSACVDLYAREDVVIGAGETKIVPLGVKIDLDNLHKLILRDYGQGIKHLSEFMQSHYLQLEPRSSLRAKGLQAGTGIIDLDYKNEVCIILHNPITGINDRGEANCICSPNAIAYRINKGERIAQIMLCEHKTWLMGIESDSERTGGFGSTGRM